MIGKVIGGLALLACFHQPLTAQSVTIGTAVPGGGTPIAAQFDVSWDPGQTGATRVELTFKHYDENGVLLGTSDTDTRTQMPGSDTYSVQFDENVEVGHEIKVEAVFKIPGQPDVYRDDYKEVTAPPQ